MKHAILVIALAATLGACSWGIKLDSGGENVRVAWDGNVAGCKDAGKVTVSVLNHVGPVDRSGLKVSDELEIMARNEAGRPRRRHDRAARRSARRCAELGRVHLRSDRARARCVRAMADAAAAERSGRNVSGQGSLRHSSGA